MNALVEKQLPEKPPLWSTGPSVTALFEAERAEVEEEEDDEEDEEEHDHVDQREIGRAHV